jgi:hypothetical protein
LKTTLKSWLPGPLWQAGRLARDAARHAALWPAAAFHPWRRASIQRLAGLKDRHRGRRCFIIGNGPSLKQMDLSRLRGEFTFGMNRFYLMFPELGFTTSYFLAVNTLVVEQCAEDLRRLPMPVFISWRSRAEYTRPGPPPENTVFLHTTYTGPGFSSDVRGRVWEGATVTNVALQLAFHMGFQQAILIGVDHNYTTAGKPNTTVVSQGADPNHFNPTYFGKGFRWQLPDLETSERGYELMRAGYAAAGRQVLDATLGGKLQVFPKVAYDTLFD